VTAAASFLLIASTYFQTSPRICWAIFGSTVSFCLAKTGKAKPIANPTRATTRGIFIDFSRGVYDALSRGCYWLLGAIVGNGVAAAVAAGRGNIAASKGYDELPLIRQAHYHPMLAKACLNCYDLPHWGSMG
jgi:hypothetical protein